MMRQRAVARTAGGGSLGLLAALALLCAPAPAAAARPEVVVSDLPAAATAALVRGLALGAPAPSGLEVVAAPASEDELSALLTSHGAAGSAVVCLGTRPSRAALALPAPLDCVFLSVEPLAQPADGRPVRGVRMTLPPDRVLASLRRVVPRARRIGLLCSCAQPGPDCAPAAAAAREVPGGEAVVRCVSRRSEIARAAQEVLEGCDVFWLTAEPLLREPDTVRYLLGRALELGRPVVGLSANFVRAGALLCLEPDLEDVGRQLGEALRAPAAGVPAGAPSEGLAFPRRATLVVNGRVARLLGLRLPDGVAGADDVRVVE